MPDIEALDILTINCNTIDTQEADRDDKCSTNTSNCKGSTCKNHYANMMQQADRPQKCYTNIVSISKSGNKDKATVIDNENSKINYFVPCHNQYTDKGVSTVITQQLQRDFKDVFTRDGCFDGHFHYRLNQIANHTRHP